MRGQLPLTGIRVVDFTRLLPGGFCTLLLADLGADVVKVEDTAHGDYARWTAPYYDGAEPSTASAYFTSLNRGKRSVQINLKEPRGRDVAMRLIHGSDVVIESFRPGVMDRLGIGYDAVHGHSPHIVYCALSGYGQDGRQRGRAGHDVNYLARAGILALTGDVERDPVIPGVQVADLSGAVLAAFGILAALRERDSSGVGQLLDIAMHDAALSLLTPLAAQVLLTGRAPSRGNYVSSGGVISYATYACKDGHVALGAWEPHFWEAWCRGVGRDDLVDHHLTPTGSREHEDVRRIFESRTAEEWADFADTHECCLDVVDTPDAALRSDLVSDRSMIATLDQPGTDGVRLLASPVRLSRTPADPNRSPAPALGEHTPSVLAELGYSCDEIAALLAANAVKTTSD